MSVRVVLHDAGFHELLNSPGVLKALTEEAQKLAAKCGDGFEAQAAVAGRERGHAYVYDATFAARYRQSQEHTMERAIGGG